MTYPEALQFLYRLNWFGARFGLANTLKLAELVGNPHRQLRFIHVAGTNGKGSTCAMLESVYRAAGLRVGLFTSPHLVTFGERIQFNRQLIPEAEIARLVSKLIPALNQAWGAPNAASEHPTFFEVVTVIALTYFLDQKCDLVVWETGLGGRLDATNIVTPLASVITNIQFDHQQWLGDTLALIAAEKAGIIKPGVPIITAAEAVDALSVITQTARDRAAPLTTVSMQDAERPPLSTIELSLSGRHQRLNAALTLATIRAISDQIPVTEQAISTGLTGVDWPGRLQLITRPSGQKILLDGAHNVAGAQALVAALNSSSFQNFSYLGLPAAKLTLILGVLRDKDWPGICRTLAPIAKRIVLTMVGSERTATPEELAFVCREANADAQIVLCTSPAAALGEVVNDAFLVVTGSLYLVGEVLELLQTTTTSGMGERSLNEWTTSPWRQRPV